MRALRSLLVPALAAILTAAVPLCAHAAAGADTATVAPAETAPNAVPVLARLPGIEPVALFGGAGAAGSAFGEGTTPSGTLADMSSRRSQLEFTAPGKHDPSSAMRAARPAAGGTGVDTTTLQQEPSGWLVLLCGVAVIAFMARRKLLLTLG